jgi:hypothetical protein
MKKAIALVLAAGAASIASAAGSITVSMIPQAASIGGGGTMMVDIFVDYSGVTGALGLAGFKFDLVGNANGTLAGTTNPVFSNGLLNGTPAGANLNDMAGGQLPPSLNPGFNVGNYIGTVAYTDGGTAVANYAVALAMADYVSPLGALNVYTGASGTQSRSSLTSSTGNFHLVNFDIRPFDVIIPTPASMALLGLGGLVAGRRRR